MKHRQYIWKYISWPCFSHFVASVGFRPEEKVIGALNELKDGAMMYMFVRPHGPEGPCVGYKQPNQEPKKATGVG